MQRYLKARPDLPENIDIPDGQRPLFELAFLMIKHYSNKNTKNQKLKEKLNRLGLQEGFGKKPDPSEAELQATDSEMKTALKKCRIEQWCKAYENSDSKQWYRLEMALDIK